MLAASAAPELTLHSLPRRSGEWVRGERQGKGSVVSRPPTVTYEGQWKANLMNGRGICTYGDGTKYEGFFKDGLKSGRGTLTFSNGAVYEGRFRDDAIEGGVGQLNMSAPASHEVVLLPAQPHPEEQPGARGDSDNDNEVMVDDGDGKARSETPGGGLLGSGAARPPTPRGGMRARDPQSTVGVSKRRKRRSGGSVVEANAQAPPEGGPRRTSTVWLIPIPSSDLKASHLRVDNRGH